METPWTEALESVTRLLQDSNSEKAQARIAELMLEFGDSASFLYELACVHDRLGLEREAIPYYTRSLALGLADPQRPEALLGLGSTYRVLGEYMQAEQVLREAAEQYPDHAELRVFLAMALYNQERHAEAMKLLLEQIAAHSAHEGVQSYQRAIRFYADRLDEVWK